MKKIIAMALALVLVAGLSIGGTVAYLSDSARNDNTMTMGKVDISQWEYQRATNDDGTYKTDTIDNRTSYVLEGFTQDKPLLPAIIPNGGTVGGVTWDYDATPVRMSQVKSHGGASVFNTPNAVDKFVVVENTGKNDAYVRTLIAFEIGSKAANEVMNNLISCEIRAGVTADGSQPWTYGDQGAIQIDGKNYFYYEFIYTGAVTSSGWKHENGVLPAGATTYPNLCQVYMAAEATNEDVAALDGNTNGKYDIIVLSQAVQADGWTAAENKHVAEFALDTAFGDANATNVAGWFAANP